MKVSFVQPNVGFKGHTWEALGIGYLISMLKNLFPEVETDFYSGFYDPDNYILRGCSDSDIVCFSCTSPQYKHAQSLARDLKVSHPTVVTVFGGAHPSALPLDVAADPVVDIVVQGEGELPILDIVNHGGVHCPKIYSYQQVCNLDQLPMPDRYKILNERNIRQAKADTGKRITSIFSSRGCPFNCAFCASRCIWKGVRSRSANHVLVEVRDVVHNLEIDFLKFSDDTFTIDKRRVLEFCEKKVTSGLDVPFGANAHINTVDEGVLIGLAGSGCEELWFGIESGSPRLRQDMHKSTSNDHIIDVFKMCKKYDIRTRAYFLLGMPTETIEDIRMTEDLCDQLDPDIVGFTLLSPYPGSAYYNPYTMKDVDWSTFDEYNNDWVRTATLSNEQLKAEQRRLVDKYPDRIAFRHKKV
jgi:radical SAM superfamily enzyme YgiQ (UPF0313 family)